MKIIEFIRDTKIQPKYKYHEGHYSKGQLMRFENPKYGVPPTGEIIAVTFSLTDDEIRQWCHHPEWHLSHRRDGGSKEFTLPMAGGQVDEYVLEGDFLPAFAARLASQLRY